MGPKTWDEAIGKNCLELGYEPWHAAMHDREIEQVVATRQPVKGEVPFTGTFGRRIYEYIFVPVLGENGEVEAVAGTTRDVTDRRQAEELMRHSEERFRSLMEQAPFSIQVFSPDGRTIRVNRAWEELWGVRFEQIAGYNVLEDRQLEARGVLHYIHQGFAGQPTRIPAIQYDPNETIPDVTQQEDPRRWLSAVIYPIKDADGRVREVVLIHEDITARQRAEEALRESERLYRAIGESIDYGVWVCDPRGRNFYASESFLRLVGLTQEQCSSFGWGEVLHPDDAARTLPPGRSVWEQAGSGTLNIASRAWTGAGILFWPVACRCGTSRARSPPGPGSTWTSAASSESRRNCGRPTGARTSSWRRWPTSSATRWPRSATRCKS